MNYVTIGSRGKLQPHVYCKSDGDIRSTDYVVINGNINHVTCNNRLDGKK